MKSDQPPAVAGGARPEAAPARTNDTPSGRRPGSGLLQEPPGPTVVLRPGAAYGLSAALGAVTLLAASASFFLPGVLQGPAVTRGTVRGTALVMMVLAVPLLFAAMSVASRNSARALVVWLGVVAYIVYQAVLFLFGTPFNALFPVYVAMLSLALWSAAALMWQIDLAGFDARFDERLPARGLAAYACVMAALNALVWLRTIVPAILSDSPPAFLDGSGMTTNPVFVQDLAVWLPLLMVASWWLVRARPLGRLIVGALLVMLVIEGIGVAADQWFGAVADPGTPFASMSAVPLFAALVVIGMVPLLVYLRHLDADRGKASGSLRHA
ncbi:hypothetical protein IWX63_001232 [Arthrobacter sp. CAN_A2]|uniref:hypothetical protein n=1 Tax=Arthrobacter sp. CAN_A2 TaxID=2787718 RepID=UPI0018EF9F39